MTTSLPYVKIHAFSIARPATDEIPFLGVLNVDHGFSQCLEYMDRTAFPFFWGAFRVFRAVRVQNEACQIFLRKPCERRLNIHCQNHTTSL